MTLQNDNMIQAAALLQPLKDYVFVPYQKVEWLQSSGSQYIDTQTFAKENTICTLRGFASLSFSIWGVFIGVDDYNSGPSSTRWMFRWPNISSKIGVITGTYIDGSSTSNNYLNFSIPYSTNEIIDEITISRSHIESSKPITVGDPPGQFTVSDYPLFLFGCNQLGALWRGTSMRLQACKIEEGGEVLRDFVAVKDNGIGYMYDKVSKRLFGNSGSGNFAVGPDIT